MSLTDTRERRPVLEMIDGLPLDALVRRHRGKQVQENALKGPLIDLDLHHPACRKFRANQAFYNCGQLAQMLLRAVQYRLLPTRAPASRPAAADPLSGSGRRQAGAQRLPLATGLGAHQLPSRLALPRCRPARIAGPGVDPLSPTETGGPGAARSSADRQNPASEQRTRLTRPS